MSGASCLLLSSRKFSSTAICFFLNSMEKPALFLNNATLFPGVIKTLKLHFNNGILSTFENSYSTDRLIVFLPPQTEQDMFLPCLCQILEYQLHSNLIVARIKGLKRFHPHELKNLQGEGRSLMVAVGHPVSDKPLEDLTAVKTLLKDIFSKLRETLNSMPVSYLQWTYK